MFPHTFSASGAGAFGVAAPDSADAVATAVGARRAGIATLHHGTGTRWAAAGEEDAAARRALQDKYPLSH
jgi:hypothetical protein